MAMRQMFLCLKLLSLKKRRSSDPVGLGLLQLITHLINVLRFLPIYQKHNRTFHKLFPGVPEAENVKQSELSDIRSLLHIC